MNGAPGAPQSRDPACPAEQVNSPRLHHVVASLHIACDNFFMLCINSHPALIPVLPLSESNPLCRASIRLIGTGNGSPEQTGNSDELSVLFFVVCIFRLWYYDGSLTVREGIHDGFIQAYRDKRTGIDRAK